MPDTAASVPDPVADATTSRGPAGRRFSGHLADFREDRLSFFTRCARDYGDVVPLRILNRRVLLLNRPDLIEQVLVTHANRFVKHFGLRLYKPLLGNGLVTSEGAFWRRQRKLSAPAFQAGRTAGYAAEMVADADRQADEWAAAARATADNSAVRDVQADMMRTTLRIACRTLFGADACPDPEVVGRAMDDGLAGIAARFRSAIPLPQWVPTPANLRLRRAVRALHGVVDDLVRRRRSGGSGDDLLWTLLKARDDDGSAMTGRQLTDEVLTILLAGHETTVLALAYAIYLLASHPAVQDRLRAELSDVVGDRPPAHADLSKLPYLRNVVTETMRLYPPADVLGREATEDCVIGGMPIRRGTTLFASQWVMHRDARYFPDPLKFDPDRWTPAFEKALPRFAYFPFGGGPRFCVGQSFALAEAALVLATLCRRFRFQADPTYALELDPGITLRPKDGVRVIVRPAN